MDEGAENTGVGGCVVDAAVPVATFVVDDVALSSEAVVVPPLRADVRVGMAWPAAARALMTSAQPFSSIRILSLSS